MSDASDELLVTSPGPGVTIVRRSKARRRRSKSYAERF
jgi:hypothetical protein